MWEMRMGANALLTCAVHVSLDRNPLLARIALILSPVVCSSSPFPPPLPRRPDPEMHAISSVALHPSTKYWCGQSMDNQSERAGCRGAAAGVLDCWKTGLMCKRGEWAMLHCAGSLWQGRWQGGGWAVP